MARFPPSAGARRFTSAQDHRAFWKCGNELMPSRRRTTLEADNMSMTIPAEMLPERQPLRCVASRSGNFDLEHRVPDFGVRFIFLPRTRKAATFPRSRIWEPPFSAPLSNSSGCWLMSRALRHFSVRAAEPYRSLASLGAIDGYI